MRIRLEFERATQEQKAQYGAPPDDDAAEQPALSIARLSWQAWEDLGRPPAIEITIEPAKWAETG